MTGRGAHGQEGQALIQVTLSLVVLLLFLGLAVDVGHFYSVRRQMQNAADAGALAGARALCLGKSWSEAAVIAEEYAEVRNGADDAVPSPGGNPPNIMSVVANEEVNTFFAGLVGLQQVTISAEAAAACNKAQTACGFFPVTLRVSRWRELQASCPTEREIWLWDDQWQVDCSLPENGPICGDVTDLGPADRRWVDFGTIAPSESTCGCGNIQCLIQEGYTGQVEIGDCISSHDGVTGSAWNTVNHWVQDLGYTPTVRIPIYDSNCSDAEYCGGDGAHIVDFGCFTILGAEQQQFYVYNPSSGRWQWRNVRYVRARMNCAACETTCGVTDPTQPPPGGADVGAVTLIR